MSKLSERYSFFHSLQGLPFVDKIILFGSRARGDNDSRADIDLAIVAPAASTNDWFKLLQIIDDADTLLNIDCVRFDELPNDSPLKKNIEIDGKIIYSKSQ